MTTIRDQRNETLADLRAAVDGDRGLLCAALGLRPDGGRWFCHACQSDGVPHADGDLSVEAGFRCHRCGWKGDGLDLVRLVKSCDFPTAVVFARNVYGIPVNKDVLAHGVTRAMLELNSTKPTKTGHKPGKTHPTLDAAVKAACWSVGKKRGKPHHEATRWPYNDGDANAIAYVIRFEPDDGAHDDLGKPEKTFMPVHAVNGGWKVGDPPGKWPLFRKRELLADDGIVFVNEGEGKALHGTNIGLLCTASAHGADSPNMTDWTPLAGRDVAILPDRDRAGRRYAEAVAGLCHATGARTIKIVELPGLPPKGDLADFVALRSGQEPTAIRAEIERMAESAAAWTPSKRETPRELPHVEGNGPLDPIGAARVGTPFALTDLGNAERLCAWHGDVIRWDTARRMWRVWDGRRWSVDSSLKVNALAAETARKIREEAAAAPKGEHKPDLGMELFCWAVKSEFRNRLAAMIEVAKAQPGIAVAGYAWDVDPWALNVANGTLDLRTGTLRLHNRADLLTKLAPVEYRSGYRDERLERFLHDATGNDEDVIAFLQVVAGYTLTGLTVEEILLLIYGPEAAGKTTFLEMLRASMGDYAATIQADLLVKHRSTNGAGSPSPEIARLDNIRLAAGSECEQGRELAEALAKNLTGGETITARHLQAEFFDFVPRFKLWLALNHCPKVSADDGAIWRRIVRIGFEHTVPPERQDKTLKPYLRDPAGGAPAVLAWAVEGCLRWQRDGLHVPDAVKRSTSAYRQESDPLATFMEDCLRFTPAAWTPWKDILTTYNEHAAEMGIGERYRVSPKRIQDRLRAQDCKSGRRYSGRGWAGVEIQDGWKSGEHAGHDAHDSSCGFLSMKDQAEEEYRSGVIADMPDMHPAVRPVPVAVQPDCLEGFADEYR